MKDNTYLNNNDKGRTASPDVNKSTDLLDEIRLVRDARLGSKEAFAGLYSTYKDRLYRYALYRLGSPEAAEDAVSECVLAAWKSIRSLRSDTAFGAWIFRILRSTCAGLISKDISARDGMERIMRDAEGQGVQDQTLHTEISDALSILTDKDREIVLLSVVSGLTSNEISDITGLKPGSVRSRLSRSLARMRAYLEK